MPDRRPKTTLMLWAAFAMPLLYFGVQLIAAPFYPGYHFATDTASMLGTSMSRHPGIFNTGAILTGIAGLVGAFGLFLGLGGAAAGWLRILIVIGVISNAVMSLKADSFLCPIRDMHHGNSCSSRPSLHRSCFYVQPGEMWLRIYLLLDVICLLYLLPYMMQRAAPILQEGTIQRLFAFVIFVPVGVVALALLRGPSPDRPNLKTTG